MISLLGTLWSGDDDRDDDTINDAFDGDDEDDTRNAEDDDGDTINIFDNNNDDELSFHMKMTILMTKCPNGSIGKVPNTRI